MRTTLAVVFSASLVSLLGAGWTFTRPPERSQPAAAPEPLPVAALRVERSSAYQVTRDFTGMIKAARTSDLSFERPGLVLDVLVDQGSSVEVGQTLARLDRRQLEARRDQLLAQRGAAQARLDELIAGPRREQVAAAKAEVQNLEAQVELLALNLERRAKLLSENAIAREEYDSAALNFRSMQAQLEAARQAYQELLNGTRAEQLAAARAAVEELSAAIALNAHDLDDCTLEAPFAGVVSERFLDEGSVVEAGTPVLRVVEGGPREAWVGLPAELAARFDAGDEETLVVDGASYPARVKSLLPELDVSTRTRRIVLELESPAADALVPGQVARLATESEAKAEGFWFPTTALTRGERGLWSCFALTPVAEHDGVYRVEPRTVEVLHVDGGRAYVRGTLSAGELVIASGTHRIVAGQSVRPAKTTFPPPASAVAGNR
ncbi:MAG: efflux RND transporter periplasmic adaptor subunit [Planctomycetota bacterium]